jgi:NAD(P)-dependent dehydrogenase (short-subunit alcohol dehydrogenase family)
MPTVFVTGASRGIGLEFARSYAADGWTVIASVRRQDDLDRLAALDGSVTPVQLDIADPASVAILGERLKGVAIDVLIANAGTYGPRGVALGQIFYPAWQEVMTVNTFGPVRVVETFLDNLRAGGQRRIAAITSKMGSIADNTSGGNYIYRTSKAALNMAMKSVALDLAGEGFAVGLFHPGWVKTDMGGPNALIDTATSVAGMREGIEALTPETTGRFWNYDRREIPW